MNDRVSAFNAVPLWPDNPVTHAKIVSHRRYHGSLTISVAIFSGVVVDLTHVNLPPLVTTAENNFQMLV